MVLMHGSFWGKFLSYKTVKSNKLFFHSKMLGWTLYGHSTYRMKNMVLWDNNITHTKISEKDPPQPSAWSLPLWCPFLQNILPIFLFKNEPKSEGPEGFFSNIGSSHVLFAHAIWTCQWSGRLSQLHSSDVLRIMSSFHWDVNPKLSTY